MYIFHSTNTWGGGGGGGGDFQFFLGGRQQVGEIFSWGGGYGE